MAKTRTIFVKPELYAKVILAAGFLLVLAANLPGQMSWDSVYALYQVRQGIALTFDPPIMNLLLGMFDKILPGTALFVTMDVTLFFGSLFVLLKLHDRVSWYSMAAALFVVASPLVLVTQGTVWHDVLFADLSIAGFTCLAWAARAWDDRVTRNIGLAGALILLVGAALARQSGIVCLFAAICGVALIARKVDRQRARRVTLRFALAGILLLIAINGALSLARMNASYGSGVKALQIFDIVGVTALDPTTDLFVLDGGDPRTRAMIRNQAKAFTPLHLGYLSLHAPTLWQFMMHQTPQRIAAQWWQILTGRPGDYLRNRFSAFGWLLFTPDVTQCLPSFVGVVGKPEWLKAIGMSAGVRAQDNAIYGYSSRFFRTPVYSHVFYACIAIALVVFFLLRGAPADIAIASMLIAALLFTAVFFFIALSCDFRFLYFLDAAAVASLFNFSVDPSRPKASA